MINSRREFFKVTLNEIEEVVKKITIRLWNLKEFHKQTNTENL